MRLTTAQAGDFWTQLRNRSLWLRLALCAAAISAMIFSLQAWKRPFPFRLEQKPPHGVVATIGFRQVNRSRTARAKERAAERVRQTQIRGAEFRRLITIHGSSP